MLEIVDYLATKGIHTYRAAGPEITCWCFFCGRHQRGKGKLYINREEGIFICHVCGKRGTVKDILEHFGDAEKREIRVVPESHRRRLLEAAATAASEQLLASEGVMLWLMGEDREHKQRGLTVETILDARLGFAPRNWSLSRNLEVPHDRAQLLDTGLVYREDTRNARGEIAHRKGDDFFRGPKLVIPYLSSQTVVQIRGRDYPEGKYQTGPGETVRLYGADDLRGAEEAIVVEGEFDRWVLKQLLASCPDDRLRRIAVVGLPGAQVFPDSWVDYFRDLRRIYLGLDPDEAGRRGSAQLQDRLGKTRARILALPEDLPKCDWTEFIVYRKAGWQQVAELIRAAASGSEGKKLWTIGESIDSLKQREAAGRIFPTGFAELDAKIDGGGFPAGSVAIVAAKTAAGKTLFTSQLIVNDVTIRQRPVDTLFFSMEMTRADVVERMLRQHWLFRPDDTTEDFLAAYAHVMICDENRVATRELGELVAEYEEIRGKRPDRIIIDHLQYLANAQRGPGVYTPYDRVTKAIDESTALAKATDCSLIIPSQVNRGAKHGEPIDMDVLRDGGTVEECAAYVITMWRPDRRADRKETERTDTLQYELSKNRRGDSHRGSLYTARLSLAITEAPPNPHGVRAYAENRRAQRGMTWAELRASYSQLKVVS